MPQFKELSNMDIVNEMYDISGELVNGDCAVVGPSVSIIGKFSFKILQAYYKNNVYFASHWDRLKQLINTVHLDVIVVNRGHGSIISQIKAYCTIPVIHIYDEDSPEESFEDCSIPYNADTIEWEATKAIAGLLSDGRDKVVFKGAVRCGDLKVDLDNYMTTFLGESIPLKPMETKLLFYLMKFRNRVAPKNSLALYVWDMPEAVYTRTIDVHIKNLRKKLLEYSVPVGIYTIRRVGYRLSDKEMP